MRNDLVVAATVQEYDDVGIGTILKVDQYFKGAGGEYLVLMRYPPALQYAGHIRKYDTGCLYAARSEDRWQKKYFGYAALSENGNGTYSVNRIFFPVDGTIEFYSENEGETGAEVTLPVHDFEQLLLNLSGESEASVPKSSPYPLMRFLNITTESGERYRLNPDRSVTWLDEAKYPVAISNDGSHVMFRLDDGELGFQYLAQLKKPFDPTRHAMGSAAPVGGSALSDGYLDSYGWLHPVRGLYGEFSPNSNFVAVQEEKRLVVYLFYSADKDGAVVGFGHQLAIREIASHTAIWRTTDSEQPMLWSADSRAIAFEDARGIRIWRITEQADPQLVVQPEDGKELLDYSASGRYLRFGNKASWTLLDVQTGKSWNDTLITPDESRLIHFLSEGAEDYAEQLQRLIQCRYPRLCPLILLQSMHTGFPTVELPQDFLWHHPDYLGLVYRDGIVSIHWSYSLEDTYCEWFCRLELSSIEATAFDAHHQQTAIAFEQSKIAISIRSPERDFYKIDLSEYLDSPIVDLEWGQPIFYEGR
ncbi:MAG: hypothetical protein OXG53_12505 [Chloroflexi bacterium]|nr:hypothetical protein [Chloroflexota bacterium]